jgi:polysaccharide biosynthesis/export protein
MSTTPSPSTGKWPESEGGPRAGVPRLAEPASLASRAGRRLNDYKADPGGFFLLRFEPASLVAQFVPDVALPPGGNLVPVIYRLNLRDAHSFFLARSFAMKDQEHHLHRQFALRSDR